MNQFKPKPFSLLPGWSLILLLIFSTLLGAGDGFTENTPKKSNRLANSKSPYLRSASHQSIDWYEYGEEAFQKAVESDRIILLDIGAVWCHWCHVMDRETYENEEVAQFINDHFVAIKLDRDLRPDLDKRYQTAIQAITGQGGWPLTVFMTSKGKIFFGGTFFPAEDRYGRIGFKKLLPKIVESYTNEKNDVEKSGDAIMDFLQTSPEEAASPVALTDDGIGKIVEDVKTQFDSVNGGFGSSPKFPSGSILELLSFQYFKTKDARLLDMLSKTLDGMARGGIYDRVGGGFHRYSVDARWDVPHFEKMAYTNAELLRNYVMGYKLTGNPDFLEVARGIVRFVLEDLSDPKKGGVFSSMDADTKEGGEGGYYGWTLQQVKSLLTPEEARVAIPSFAMDETGDLPEKPGWNVLRVNRESKDPGGAEKEEKLIRSSLEKLKRERDKRVPPFVDETMFSEINAMMATAFLEYAKVDPSVPEAAPFALKSLDLILKTVYEKGNGVRHVLSSPAAPPLLEDQAFVAEACLSAFEATADTAYLETAEDLADYSIEHFWDSKKGGFFDTEISGDLRFIPVSVKSFSDVPYVSANSKWVENLIRLDLLTGDKRYSDYAEKTLLSFSQSGVQPGSQNAGYGVALFQWIHSPTHVVIVGGKGDEVVQKLWKAGLSTYRPGKFVSVFDPTGPLKSPYPPDPAGKVVAYVCTGKVCSTPVSDPASVVKLVETQPGG